MPRKGMIKRNLAPLTLERVSRQLAEHRKRSQAIEAYITSLKGRLKTEEGDPLRRYLEREKILLQNEKIRLEGVFDALSTDHLTKIGNKAFHDHAKGFVATQGTRGTVEHAAVVTIDLNNFKTLNDTKGHEAGDAALSHLGELLNELRKTDFVYRYAQQGTSRKGDMHASRVGGDEVNIIFPGLTQEQAAELVRKRIEAPYVSRPENHPSSLAIGVHEVKFVKADRGSEAKAYEENLKAIIEGFKQADKKMYEDKARKGGGR